MKNESIYPNRIGALKSTEVLVNPLFSEKDTKTHSPKHETETRIFRDYFGITGEFRRIDLTREYYPQNFAPPS